LIAPMDCDARVVAVAGANVLKPLNDQPFIQ
jgi:hypothetical protein